jgi:prepilin-type N-terminal cleavage/methylation domain-containing protein/prepilin-type processing-associated H-X9-DG protein
MKQKQGFTLIEILVVIAIIGVLAAMIFPVFSQARIKARQSVCLANVKQIIAATLMYADDNGDCLPVACWTGYWRVNLPSAVLPYAKSGKIFHCPQDKQGSNGFSYPANDSPEGPMIGWYGTSSAMIMIDDPSNTILVLCAPLNPAAFPDHDHIKNRYAYIDDNYPNFEDETSPRNVFDLSLPDWSMGMGVSINPGNFMFQYGRAKGYWQTQNHNGGTIYGFADGHAKWMTLPDTLTPVNMWSSSGSD